MKRWQAEFPPDEQLMSLLEQQQGDGLRPLKDDLYMHELPEFHKTEEMLEQEKIARSAISTAGVASEDRDPHQDLVAKILSRWWYVLPQWPPKNYDYRPHMLKEKLREVSETRWEDEHDVDGEGLRKCKQHKEFPGVFVDFEENSFDLRPVRSMPCYQTLIRRSTVELHEMLIRAIQNESAILSMQYDEQGEQQREALADLERELDAVKVLQGKAQKNLSLQRRSLTNEQAVQQGLRDLRRAERPTPSGGANNGSV